MNVNINIGGSGPSLDKKLEKQLVLRLPEAEAAKLKEDVENNREGTYSIQFNDPRTGVYKRDGVEFNCSLVDLPTYIETHKTYDNITFYKSADVHQMIVVQPKRLEDGSVPMPPDYRYPDGLTPPAEALVARAFDKFPDPDKESIVEVEQRLYQLDKGEVATKETYELVEVERIVNVVEDEEWSSDDDKMPGLGALTTGRDTPGSSKRRTSSRRPSSQRLDASFPALSDMHNEESFPYTPDTGLRAFTTGNRRTPKRLTSGRRQKSGRRPTPRQHSPSMPSMSPSIGASLNTPSLHTPQLSMHTFPTPESRFPSPRPSPAPGSMTMTTPSFGSSSPQSLEASLGALGMPGAMSGMAGPPSRGQGGGLGNVPGGALSAPPVFGAGAGFASSSPALAGGMAPAQAPLGTNEFNGFPGPAPSSAPVLAQQAKLRSEIAQLNQQIASLEQKMLTVRNVVLKRKNKSQVASMRQAKEQKERELQQIT